MATDIGAITILSTGADVSTHSIGTGGTAGTGMTPSIGTDGDGGRIITVGGRGDLGGRGDRGDLIPGGQVTVPSPFTRYIPPVHSQRQCAAVTTEWLERASTGLFPAEG